MKVDTQVFWARAGAICAMFAKHKEDPASALYGQAALFVWSGKHPENEDENDDEVKDADYALASRMSIFLTGGFEFPETLFAFTPTSICISASEKKLRWLQPCAAENALLKKNVQLTLVPRSKEESAACVGQIFSALKLSVEGESSCTGFLHQIESGFARELVEGMQNDRFQQSAKALEEALYWTKRDAKAVTLTRSVCDKLCALNETFRKSIPAFDEEPTLHQTEVKRLEKQLTSEKEDMDPITRFCNVQSGSGTGFALGVHATRSPQPGNVQTDNTICLKLGAIQSSFAACVMRTVFVDPGEEVKEAYAVLLAMRDTLVRALRPGTRVRDAYAKAMQHLEGKSFAACLDATALGYAVGTAGFSQTLSLAADNDLQVAEGMIWALDLRLVQSEGSKPYACEIGDLVLVTAAEGNEILTAGAKVDWKRSHFRLQGEGEEEEKSAKRRDGEEDEEEQRAPTTRRTRNQEKADQLQQRVSREQEMGRHQWERMMAKRDAALRKNMLRGAGGGGAEDGASGLHQDRLVNTYAKAQDLPASETMKRDRIHIDSKHECVLLPLGDRMVPFHISTIKNVSKVEEGQDAAILRLNFHFPSATSTAAQFKDLPPEMAQAIESFPQLAYIKELTFKSRDLTTVTKLVQSIRDLAKRAKERHRKDSDESNLVQQAALQLLKERPKDAPATLVDVSMYPSFSGRASVGRLRAHVNGFRFQAEKLGDLDVLYDNIKYFFFMRGERELKVCIHFYLKNAIMIGKRKSKHVQFYTEVQEGSSDLQGRGGYDPDEIEDEERQRRLVIKLNKTFAQFCRQSIGIAKQYGHDLEIEAINTEETRSKAFFGMPAKETLLIQPTAHCLANLSEKDPFVLAVDEIEHIHLQRLSIGKIRNFDMVFILKAQIALDRSGDSLKVVRIENVPIERLDVIRDWIDSHEELTYTVGEAALKWETVLDGVRWELDQGFFWLDRDNEGQKKDIGWLFLSPQGVDDESSEGDEDDSNFSESDEDGSGDGDEGSEETDDSDIESEVDEDSDDSGGAGSSEDEGEDWEEMDKRAEQQDRNSRYARDDDKEEERRPKKKSRH